MPATRAHALNLLEAFTPRMGKRYASGRNYDRGPGQHTAVSCLSPYVRRRLVTEAELVDAAIAAHGLDGAEKFVQEVFWRSYFKGWLERRPVIWTTYRTGLDADLAAVEADRVLRKRLVRTEAGATGIDCFDAWAEELVETGYLHNHARMWFASIWIFTLELPWRVGADFFYRHLLDGDPASNTLSWRWVAGLHTRGKVYQARPDNIAKYTNQRFTPGRAELADGLEGLEGSEPEGLPPVSPVRDIRVPQRDVPTALLITEDDCKLEDFDLAGMEVVATATLSASHLRSPRDVSEEVAAFEADALQDAAARVDHPSEALRAGDPGDVLRWAAKAGARQIVTPFVPQGPLRDWFVATAPAFDEAGITLGEYRRDWDDAVWPHATAGFFKVKQQIPRILGALEAA